jgi:alginate O-acetyltransferase complex protein AlgI
MSFNSLQYFAFFGVVLLIYYRLPKRGQNLLMIVAGSVFYGAFDWRFLGLLYLSIAIDYLVGRGLGSTDDAGRRKRLLAVSLVGQLGILAFFKYFGFFSESATRFLDKIGLSPDEFTLHVLLPVGISFYTFQTLAYVFAVYRRQLPPERDLVTFGAFVAWFPQLVAGPIESATSLLPQIQRRRDTPSAPTVESGVALILRGLFKKIVIADALATYVNTVYAHPGSYGWKPLTLATVGFAVQVYGDFSGYTDIARGSSRLLGVELRRNFEQPYLSRDIREFWTRWHTSLSWWFVEFVGRPLGGATRGRGVALRNVLIIFTLIGLWHGAAWHYVFWGFLNGVLVVIWRRFIPVPARRHPMKVRWREAPSIAFTFGLFCLGVAFFRANTMGDAAVVVTNILTFHTGPPGPSGAALIPIMLGLVLLLDIAERRQRISAIESLRVRATLGGVPTPEEAVAESPIPLSSPVLAGVIVGALIVGIVVFSGGTPTKFIYFQF